MPVYEYDCLKCLSKFEVQRGFHETGGNSCPKCGAEGRRIYFAPPLIFKGPGFYTTDSRTEVDPALEENKPEKPDSVKPATEQSQEIPKNETRPNKPWVQPEPDNAYN